MIVIAIALMLAQNIVLGFMLHSGWKSGEIDEVGVVFLGLINAIASVLWIPLVLVFSL